MRGGVSGVIGLLMITACLPGPTRVSPASLGKEGTLKTSLAPGAVGAVGRGGAALPLAGVANPAIAAPIISNNGANVLKGSVRVPASIVSHNGGNIVSNNGGTIISHNGGNIISHNGGNVRISQVPLAFTTVRLKDAAGAPVKDARGQDLVTKTDANGNYAFPVEVKGRNLVIEADVEGQAGKLKSLLPKDGLEAGKGLDVDLTSTLTLAYILEQYVKGDLATFERLTRDIEAKARVVTEEAIVEKQIELPKTLDEGAIVAKVDEVRSADPEVDQIFEEIKKLLVIAGVVREGDGLRALEVAPGTVGATLYDKEGNLFVFSQSLHNVWKIDTAGIVHTIVASGNWGYKEQATGWLTPGYTSGAVFDAAGNLILADTYNNRVVRISQAGRVSVVAGTGVAGFGGDGGDATLAQLNRPSGLAMDAAGNLFVSDTENHRIRKITLDGKIQTEVGDGIAGNTGDGHAGRSARVNRPQGLATGLNGELYIADFANNKVRFLASSGVVSTFRPEAGEVHSPIVVTFDANQELLCLSHQSSQVFRFGRDALYMVLPSNFRLGEGTYDFYFSRTLAYMGEKLMLQSQPGHLVTTTLQGTVSPVMGPIGTSALPVAMFEYAYNLVVDTEENVFVTDMGAKRILKVRPTGSIEVVVGNGEEWPTGRFELDSTNGVGMVSGLALAQDGTLLFTTNGKAPSVSQILAPNQISRIIGSGKVDYQNLPVGKAREVNLANPYSVAQLPDGRIVFAEPVENRIGYLDGTGEVQLLVPPEKIMGPDLIELDRGGTLYVWERGRRQISRLGQNGLQPVLGYREIEQSLGNTDVKALAFDAQNRLFVASDKRVIRIDGLGKSTLIAGEGANLLGGTTRDEGLMSISDICFSRNGHLFVLETQQLKRIPKEQLLIP
jgi:sugar lactone lactonase YvrE